MPTVLEMRGHGISLVGPKTSWRIADGNGGIHVRASGHNYNPGSNENEKEPNSGFITTLMRTTL